MSGFLMVPINENGVVVDTNIATNAANAMAPDIDLNEIFLYSHGWSTDADGAMTLYNRFSIEFSRFLVGRPVPAGLRAVAGLLSVGIHWPSEIVEDGSNVPDAFAKIIGMVQPLTLYSMERRADAVGMHGVYSVLRQFITNWQPRNRALQLPLRINLLGHSFGCKVIAAAVQAIADDLVSRKIEPKVDLLWNVVLIEPAFQTNNLSPGGCYEDLAGMPNLRLLVTTSQEDTALTEAFPLAHRIVDFFGVDSALGATGPDDKTVAAFGGATHLPIVPGFSLAQSKAATTKLVVADLTPLHRANPNRSGWGGHHSDFNYSEVYALVAGFLF